MFLLSSYSYKCNAGCLSNVGLTSRISADYLLTKIKVHVNRTAVCLSNVTSFVLTFLLST